MDQEPGSFIITTPEGGMLDLEPLIEAAHGIRSNAMIDREHGEEGAASRIGVAYTIMGMKVALKHVLGDEAVRVFSEAVEESRNEGKS